MTKKVEVPKSEEEISEFIGKIGKHQRELTQIETDLNDRIEKIKAKAEEYISSHQKAIEELFAGIFIFADKHRDKLTEKGEKKTVCFPTGDILWRRMPFAVSVASRNIKKAIEMCKYLGLERFIRVKEELDKEAMLKEREVAKKIWGVNITQKEQFVVKPAEVVEIVRDTKKLQKVLSKK
ncbi:host-nuclease inhibitor Gam family protein [Patescibacteria group bacterium]|nr:host-nuclease inhibitor Gam family protein [Patescibacteria group bacterium]